MKQGLAPRSMECKKQSGRGTRIDNENENEKPGKRCW